MNRLLWTRFNCRFNCRYYSAVSSSSKYLESLLVEPVNKAFCITLNGKPLKVPGTKDNISVPSPLLADLLIAEWQGSLSLSNEKPAPLSSLIFRSVELETTPELKGQVINDLLKYLHTDTICFFDSDEKFFSKQQHLWTPIHNALEQKFAFKIATTTGLLGSDQPYDVVNRFVGDLEASSSFCISAFESLVRNLKSFLLPMALKHSIIDPDTALKAALVESDFQESQWGTISENHDINRESLTRQTYLATLLLNNTN